jgi:hypothetical protein
MNDSMNTAELKQMIAGALKIQCPKTRKAALKACQWRLRGPRGEFVGLGPVSAGLPCQFVPEASASVFDGRDNEDTKLAIFQRALGPLTVEIIPQIL